MLGVDDRPAHRSLREQLASSPDFVIVELRTGHHQLAGEMRQRCLAAKPRRSLKTPDAQHVAAAILAGVDEMWTTDPKLVSYQKDGLLGDTPVVFPHAQFRFRFPSSS